MADTIDVPHFELHDNQSFWLEHNVQVLIRVRPLVEAEKKVSGCRRCLRQETAQHITWTGQPETRFTFDHVACETLGQEKLFDIVGLPMVENCMLGFNSCLIAYGQTRSGKTYTMLGDIEHLETKPSPNRGMTPRIFESLFARMRAEEESRKGEKLRYQCKCSYLEIYNEQINDLLNPSTTNLTLHTDIKKGTYVEKLSEHDIQSVVDVLNHLVSGSAYRKVAATNMNKESSRSHSVFTCIVDCVWENDGTVNFQSARINLVDLAGSEKHKTSGAEGDRFKEAAHINKSLLALGTVIRALNVEHPGHVCYRDSLLTRLLQDCLGGNSKTTILANVSPSSSSATETLRTLDFARRAKVIRNKAFVNKVSSKKKDWSLIEHHNVGPSTVFCIEERDEHSGPVVGVETQDGACTQYEEIVSLKLELKRTQSDLEECRKELSSCIENYTKLQGDMKELQVLVTGSNFVIRDHPNTAEVIEQREFKRRRCPKSWSVLEENTLRDGVDKFGTGNWQLILNSNRDIFVGRTGVDLKDKWRNITKKGGRAKEKSACEERQGRSAAVC